MESSSSTTTTKYQQVIVDVPEERVAEFHAFFARFLAGRGARRGRGRHGRPGFGPHGHRCEGHGASAEPGADPQTSEVSDV
jgi:hypothetical protein